MSAAAERGWGGTSQTWDPDAQSLKMLLEVCTMADMPEHTLAAGAKVPRNLSSGLLTCSSNGKNCGHSSASFLGNTRLKDGAYLPPSLPFLIKIFSSCFCFQAHNVKHTN